ncbi:unnamed protein product [Meloidogyne enterolobii]|uniref:Uncharacterized protein n=1 Tax=Meloidogyne enterolobii TaxID=390850 RepID=A0ACB0ZFT7_MELEN
MNAKNMNGGYEEFNNFWKNWLDGTKFLKKVFIVKMKELINKFQYNHFLLILCFVSKNDLKEAENYCRFVESRIRLELIFSIELNQREIKYTHSTDMEKCLPNEIKREYGGYYIQYWWVGIETYNEIEDLELGKNNEESNILTKFADKIKERMPVILARTGGSLELFYYNLEAINKIMNEC